MSEFRSVFLFHCKIIFVFISPHSFYNEAPMTMKFPAPLLRTDMRKINVLLEFNVASRSKNCRHGHHNGKQTDSGSDVFQQISTAITDVLVMNAAIKNDCAKIIHETL